jgi:RNA-directed DNA polymerase
MIPKSGGRERALSIPEIEDQIVQAALQKVLQPIFEPTFSNCSYGYRKRRGAREALGRVADLLEAGFVAVVDAEIEKFFDSIPKQRLLDQVGKKVKDGRVIKLIRAFLTAGYMQEGQFYLQEQGTPQGAVISPLLANIYLNQMDQLITAQGRFELVRYADDFVILCRTMEEAPELPAGRCGLPAQRRWW